MEYPQGKTIQVIKALSEEQTKLLLQCQCYVNNDHGECVLQTMQIFEVL